MIFRFVFVAKQEGWWNLLKRVKNKRQQYPEEHAKIMTNLFSSEAEIRYNLNKYKMLLEL